MAEIVFEDQIVSRGGDIHSWAHFDKKPIRVDFKRETLEDSWQKRGLARPDTDKSAKEVFLSHRYYFETLAKRKLLVLVSQYGKEAVEWMEI